MRVGYNDLFAAGTGRGIVVGAKVKIRCGSTLMEIFREIHWRSPKDAITPADDFAKTS